MINFIFSWTVLKIIVYYFLTMIAIKIVRTKIAGNNKSIMVVLGSGGHTGELLIMLKKLKLNKFSEIFFISAHNDIRSEGKVREVLDTKGCEDKIYFYKIYRARNVGQSFKSSIPTTLYAMLHSVFLMLKTRPNMVI
jgi:beta-1,4-N-acetylglucosaminyltransferase